MKTTFTIQYNKKLSLLFLFLAFTTLVWSQEIQVKGVVTGTFNEVVEALPDVNVYLKGTATGTTTDKKGEFTFPKSLSVGDILVFSYLGYKKKEIKISKTSTFLRVLLEEDDNVLLGASNSNKRYKSKAHKD